MTEGELMRKIRGEIFPGSRIDAVPYGASEGKIPARGTGGFVPSTVPTLGVFASAKTEAPTALSQINLPPYVVGNRLIAVYQRSVGTEVPAPPGGWTAVGSNTLTTEISYGIWTRVADGSEGTKITLTPTGTIATAIALTLTNAGVPVAGTNGRLSTLTANPPVVAPSPTPTTPGQLLISIYAVAGSGALATAQMFAPAGQIATALALVSGANSLMMMLGYETLATSSAPGTRTASTTTGATTCHWAASGICVPKLV